MEKAEAEKAQAIVEEIRAGTEYDLDGLIGYPFRREDVLMVAAQETDMSIEEFRRLAMDADMIDRIGEKFYDGLLQDWTSIMADAIEAELGRYANNGKDEERQEGKNQCRDSG